MFFQAQEQIREIDARQLNTQLANGFNGYIVDVREHAEVRQTGVIPGALHIPLSQLPAKAGSLPKDGTAVVVCRSGARSRVGTQIIGSTGRAALNLSGGMLEWMSAGLPVEQR